MCSNIKANVTTKRNEIGLLTDIPETPIPGLEVTEIKALYARSIQYHTL